MRWIQVWPLTAWLKTTSRLCWRRKPCGMLHAASCRRMKVMALLAFSPTSITHSFNLVTRGRRCSLQSPVGFGMGKRGVWGREEREGRQIIIIVILWHAIEFCVDLCYRTKWFRRAGSQNLHWNKLDKNTWKRGTRCMKCFVWFPAAWRHRLTRGLFVQNKIWTLPWRTGHMNHF